MSVEEILFMEDSKDPLDPKYSTVVSSSGLYSGSDKYKKDAAQIVSLYNELMVTLEPKFRIWVMDYKIEPNLEDSHRYFGVFTNLPEEIGANNQRLYNSEGSRLASIIMLNYALYKTLLKKNPDILEYYMFHEMLHGEYELGEKQTYTLLAKFFKHMAFISYGKKKKKYQKLAKLAKHGLSEYNKAPYETVTRALATTNSELRRSNISKTYRNQLLSYKAYLMAEKKKLEKIRKKKKRSKKTKKQTKSNSKNNSKKKNNKKTSKKTKTAKSKGKTGKNSGSKGSKK